MKLIHRFPFRGPDSLFNPCPSPRVKVPSLSSHRGSVSELSLVSHTLPIHWFHWRNKRSVSYYSSYQKQIVTSQIRNDGKKLNKIKFIFSQDDKAFFPICLVPIINNNNIIYFGTEKTNTAPRFFLTIGLYCSLYQQ